MVLRDRRNAFELASENDFLDDFRHRGFGCFFQIACHEWSHRVYIYICILLIGRPQYMVRVPFFVAGAASAEEAVESLECGLYSVVCGLRSAGCVGSRVWSVECIVQSVECGVRSLKTKVRSLGNRSVVVWTRVSFDGLVVV